MRTTSTHCVPSARVLRGTKLPATFALVTALVAALAPHASAMVCMHTERRSDDDTGRPIAPAAKPRTRTSPTTTPSTTPSTSQPNRPDAAVPAQATQPAPANERRVDPARAKDAPDETEFRVSCGFIKTRAADAPPLDSVDERNREQLGRLVFSRMDIAVEDRPMREVLRAVRKALGINLVIFEDSEAGPGFDLDLPLSLTLEGATGREVLETIAGMSGMSATWQIHNSTVELGPKSVLARDSARRTAVYETTDLALDPPDYLPPLVNPSKESYNRRDSDENTGELVRMIVSHCEPEAFHPPPPQMAEDASGKLRPVGHHVAPATRSPARSIHSGRTNPNTTATVNYDPDTAQVFVVGKWAAIQAKDNNLSVSAPDFVHRAIDGYGEPIPPKASR